MLKVTVLVALIVVVGSVSSAQSVTEQSFNSSAKQLFDSGTEPSSSQILSGWACFYWDTSFLRIGTDYEPLQKDGTLYLANFGSTQEHVPLKKMNGALIGESKSSDGRGFVALRVVEVSGATKLVIEESSDFKPWQNPVVKSKITGFTPHLYSICLKKTVLEGNLLSR